MAEPRVDAPRSTRPIRIPERVPLGRCEPETAFAGEMSAWTLPLELACGVPAGAVLRLQLFGGRNNKGTFDAQADQPGGYGYITARTAAGRTIPLRAAEVAGTFELTVPEGGLRKHDVLTVTLGDHSGIRAPETRTLDKFFVLYVADRSAQALPAWVVGDSRSSAELKKDLGAVWSEDNQRHIVAACTMHVLGGPVRQLRAYVPSQSKPGERLTILVRPEDEFSNLSHETLDHVAALLGDEQLDAEVEPVRESTCVRLTVRLPGEGAHRIRVLDRTKGLEAVANPTVCRSGSAAHRFFWGMIHGHTELSDGQGNIDQYFRQMRDEAGLDFAAPGDHDHLWETPGPLWEKACDAVARWNEPGRFVTFLGYEWAKWTRKGHGDRNIYYLEDHRPMYRSDEVNFPTPPDLFRAIQNETAIVVPHHTGHYGNFCDWKDHDPEHERLVEIFQLRGSYERGDDNPVPERGQEPPMECGYVSRALAMGWRVGFTAGGDDHIGHAGTEFPITGGETRYKAGLMAVLAAERSREAIWDAMWSRRVVATTGPRILLNYELNGRPIGSELDAKACPGITERRRLDIEFHGTAPADRIDIIRNNDIVQTFAPGELDCELSWEDAAPLGDVLLPPATFCAHPFCFYYVRAIQSDGEVAWASPVWIDPA